MYMFLSRFMRQEEEEQPKIIQTPSITFSGDGKLTHIRIFKTWDAFRIYVDTNFWLIYDIAKVFDDAIKNPDVLDPPIYDLREFYLWIHCVN